MIAQLQPRSWAVWDVFFPPLCAICGGELSSDAILFCARCWAEAPMAENRDLRPLKHVDMARAAYRFGGDNVVREAVHALKFDGMKRLAAVLARTMIARLPTRFVESDVTWVPVPLHWTRTLSRGFNQSELIASELALLTNHSDPVMFLKRVRRTPTQTARNYRDRAANVRGAFSALLMKDVPKRVLLIDDVITTGATMDECARTCKNAGVEWVGALSFALTRTA